MSGENDDDDDALLAEFGYEECEPELRAPEMELDEVQSTLLSVAAPIALWAAFGLFRARPLAPWTVVAAAAFGVGLLGIHRGARWSPFVSAGAHVAMVLMIVVRVFLAGLPRATVGSIAELLLDLVILVYAVIGAAYMLVWCWTALVDRRFAGRRDAVLFRMEATDLAQGSSERHAAKHAHAGPWDGCTLEPCTLERREVAALRAAARRAESRSGRKPPSR